MPETVFLCLQLLTTPHHYIIEGNKLHKRSSNQICLGHYLSAHLTSSSRRTSPDRPSIHLRTRKVVHKKVPFCPFRGTLRGRADIKGSFLPLFKSTFECSHFVRILTSSLVLAKLHF